MATSVAGGLFLEGSSFVCGSTVFFGGVHEHQTLAGMRVGMQNPARALAGPGRGHVANPEPHLAGQAGLSHLVISRERSRRFDPAQVTAAMGQRLEVDTHPEGIGES